MLPAPSGEMTPTTPVADVPRRSVAWSAAALVAGLLLCGGGIALWGCLQWIFPHAPPVPPAAVAPGPGAGNETGVGPPGERLQARFSLIEHLAEVEQVELPSLAAAYPVAARGYGRGVPLQLAQLQEPLRKVAVAMPLGLVPGSAAEADHEVRHALYLPTPARLVWRCTLPARARLRFAPTMLPLPGQPAGARVEVLVTALDGDEHLRGAVEVGPAPLHPQPGRPWWPDAEVDLSPLAGRPVLLELATRAVGTGAGVAQVLVGDPVVLGLPDPGQPRRPNVLFINVDTMQGATTQVGGGPARITPQFNRLAQGGVAFSRAYAASNWTRPANMAFMTGMYPSEMGMKMVMIPTLPEERRSFYLSDIVPLPLQLDRHGYLTRAVVQNNLLEDVWGTGVDIGFREYRYVEETLEHTQRITEAAIGFIEAHRKETWFLYLGYNAPHWPYRPTRESLADVGIALDHPRDWLASVYRGEVRFTDDHFAPLIATLRNLGLERDTLVVINSDHGEQISVEHAREQIRASLWEADAPGPVVSRPGHETLFDEVVRVPLLLSWPGTLPVGRVIQQPVAMYDLPLTILDLLQLPPLPGARGRSLVPLLRGQSVPDVPLLIQAKSALGIVDGPLKYVRRGRGLGEEWVRDLYRGGPWRRVPEELYDLVADPGELHDLAPSHPAEVARLRQTLERLDPRDRYLYLLELRAVGQSPPAGENEGPASPPGPATAPSAVAPVGAPRSASPASAATERAMPPSPAPPGTDPTAPVLDSPGWVRVQWVPDDAVGAIHLLEEEPDDRLEHLPGRWQALLHLGPGDFDRLSWRTASLEAKVAVTVEAVESAAGPSALPDAPIRVGRFALPAEESPLLVCDGSPYQLLDSDRDPPRDRPGVYLWRLPVIDGIPGRGGELDAAMQETFRGWGYVK